jgi:murein DD-endopeptidase MepM/ murein hydrolase activator NlpD
MGCRGAQPLWAALLVVGLAIAACLGLTLAQPVQAQEPIVQPGDVSTPTATPLAPAALPTPTPPAGTASVIGEPAAAARDPLDPHLDAPAVSPVGMDASAGYTVRMGDTLFTVALEMGLDLDDVPCAIAPDFMMDQPLVIGNTLSIPPANLACHTVLNGDTLSSIAAQYGSTAEQIYLLPWNRLSGAGDSDAVTLVPGTHLRVPLPLAAFWQPGASSNAPLPGADNPDGLKEASFLPLMLAMPLNTSPFVVLGAGAARSDRGAAHKTIGPVPADWPYGSGSFVWPVYGWLSQGYRYDHRAIDVAANLGTPITAADRGVVVRAGWNDQGYGRFVVIDHQIDYVTLYAHLDRILVQEGDIVGQGQVIGTVGSTGNSTGPHLHFEIRDFGRLTNPLELLAQN